MTTTPLAGERSAPTVPHSGLRVRPRARRRLAPPRATARWLALGPVLLVAAWVVGSATGLIDPDTFSPPWTVLATFGELVGEGRLQSNLLSSLQRAGLGLLFGVVSGVVLALVAGLSRIGEALVDGPVQIKRAIPTLALIPLVIVWFGIGEEMKVLVVSLAVFVPIYINTHAALRGIDARYVELAESVELSRAAFLRRVAVPGALPGFFTGLRLAVTIAWTALVVVEQVNATSGIGYLMTQARIYGLTEIIIVGLVVYAVLGLVSDTVVRAIERRALSWRRALGS